MQQQAKFYDGLLRCLNKAFFTNLKTQELYLDLARNTRKLRFKSIKNIYNTLTESKADEIIYHKEKPNLVNSQVYNQLYTQRTCWRLIEKLITKIAYYLTNERGLKDLAPTILKAVGYTRKATDKITHKATFIEFFSGVVDLLIQENNILEKKIYSILIQRGYIYSVDQFYKMSRFESNTDFMYAISSGENSDGFSERASRDIQAKSSPQQPHDLKSKSRKGIFSTHKLLKSRVSMFQGINLEDQLQLEDSPDQKQDSDSEITQIIGNSVSSIDPEEELQKINKLNHAVHEQVDKVIEEFIHHPNFEPFIASCKEEKEISNHSPKQEHKSPHKQPVIKQIIKNIRLKKFKANQKLLQINQQDLKSGDRQNRNMKRKGSLQTKSKRAKIGLKKSPSIITTMSKRIKEKIFKTEAVGQVQELIIKNLGNFQKTISSEDKTGAARRLDHNRYSNSRKSIMRVARRQNTENIQIGASPILHQQKHRRSSNMHFLNNAFVFNSGTKNRSGFAVDRYNTFATEGNHYQSTFKSQQTVVSNKNIDSSRRSLLHSGQNTETGPFTNEKLLNFSNFRKSDIKKKSHNNNRSKFNTAIIQFAAKKYNRYSTEANNLNENLKDLLNLQYVFKDQPSHSKFNSQSKMQPLQQPLYYHKRKYEVFDRRKRRIL